ncbi:hypothetical protein M427DRAFT_220061 [Gonapodya prolifera JEL478]|uniref:Secreted protein n=1 Tax=Gonapodya prolifera (strain JEL478) TaxID=1344416 RepID=A0A138ZYI9_GONPJ|nr:hypothetical protein M427DRAFT_220061 [Gonapodya prolifera JEL478]|eukprot:KXS09572.1 hypothetical protein M427DRAFT_220061 [Gonapodya prolifera JEL478]
MFYWLLFLLRVSRLRCQVTHVLPYSSQCFCVHSDVPAATTALYTFKMIAACVDISQTHALALAHSRRMDAMKNSEGTTLMSCCHGGGSRHTAAASALAPTIAAS